MATTKNNFESSFSDYDISLHGVRLPEFEIEKKYKDEIGLPKDCNNFTFLKSLCEKNLSDRIEDLTFKSGKKENEYTDRVSKELKIIKELGFVDYILLVWSVTNYCHENIIPLGNARGSSASSLVLFLIGITKIDPIKYGLYFERFISKTRAKKQVINDVVYLDSDLMCDIDIDVCYYARPKLLKYLEEKFSGRVCKISTVSHLQSKLLIKECGKVIGRLDETEVKYIANLIPEKYGQAQDIDLTRYGDEETPAVDEFSEWCEENEKIYETALKLRGLIKNKSIHPSALLVSYDNIENSTAIEITNSGEMVSSYDMVWATKNNVKLDLLGLRAVSVVDAVCKDIGINQEDINIDDPIIYQSLQELKTPHGLFQIEANTAFKECRKIAPRNLEQLSGVLAIARPGALQFSDKYASYTNTETVQSVHPFFDDILQESGGLCLSGDTELINASSGEKFLLKDAKEGVLLQTINENSYKTENKKIKKVFRNGLKKVFNVKLNNGLEIKSTVNHKFLTERGWKKLKDLNINDYIATPLKINKQKCDAINKNLNLKKLSKNLELNWVKINDILHVGIEEVYDLEIEDNHNYLANNIIVHNCIYQEQLMKMGNKIGFTLDESEIIRRVVGKKKVEEVKKWKPKIKAKIKEMGLEPEIGDIFWKILEDSANYSFNKSHSIAYAILSATTVYLKFKYPQKFFLALLKNSRFEPKPIKEISLIHPELIYFNVKLLPPHLSKSELNFSIEEKDIRFGLLSIKGVSDKSIDKLVKFKNHGSTKFEIFQAAQDSKLGIGILSALIQAGALEGYQQTRCRVVLEAQLWHLLTPKERKLAMQHENECNYDLFHIYKEILINKIDEKGKPVIKQSRRDTIAKRFEGYREIYNQNLENMRFCNWWYENNLLGYTYNTSLKEIFLKEYKNLTSISDVLLQPNDKFVDLIAIVESSKERKSANGNKYLKMNVRDETGSLDCLLFDNSRRKGIEECRSMNKELPKENNIVYIKGIKKQDAIFANQIITQDKKVYTRLKEVEKFITT